MSDTSLLTGSGIVEVLKQLARTNEYRYLAKVHSVLIENQGAIREYYFRDDRSRENWRDSLAPPQSQWTEDLETGWGASQPEKPVPEDGRLSPRLSNFVQTSRSGGVGRGRAPLPPEEVPLPLRRLGRKIRTFSPCRKQHERV
jgi:neutral trehalase